MKTEKNVIPSVGEVFPSGVYYHKAICTQSRSVLTHQTDRRNLEIFLRKGGIFIVNSEKAEASYSAINNSIKIHPIQSTGKEAFILNLSHELQHFDDSEKLEKATHGKKISANNYTIQTFQYAYHLMEMSAIYNTMKNSFETSQQQWDYFSEKETALSVVVEYALDANGVKPGMKIPKEFNALIADVSVLGYSYHCDVNQDTQAMEFDKAAGHRHFYQKNLVDNFNRIESVYSNFYKESSGKIDYSCGKVNEIIGLPTSFSEKLITNLCSFEKTTMNDFKSQDLGKHVAYSRINKQNKNNIAKAMWREILNQYTKQIS